MTFQGYRRGDGKAGTRNFVLVIPSVGCSQGAARAIARGFRDAVYLPNILGCGQVGADQALLKKTLAGFGINPNVYSVLVVGNGCESLLPDELGEAIAAHGKPVEVIVIQKVGGVRKTVALGRTIVTRDAYPRGAGHKGTHPAQRSHSRHRMRGLGLHLGPRVEPCGRRCIGHARGRGRDRHPLRNARDHRRGAPPRPARAHTGNSEKSARRRGMVGRQGHRGGAEHREVNPSPGNKAGGITTLEEKSLGCIHKAGTTPLEEFVAACPSHA